MVRAITVLVTFRLSRNSCIGLLVSNIQIKYYDKGFRETNHKNKTEDIVVMSSVLFLWFDACLLAVRARSHQTTRTKQKDITTIHASDDSGQQQVTKEQQRLSSK